MLLRLIWRLLSIVVLLIALIFFLALLMQLGARGGLTALPSAFSSAVEFTVEYVKGLAQGDLGEVASPCGRHSIRINPRGQVIPCVYWPVNSRPTPHIADLATLGVRVLDSDDFSTARHTPASAIDCPCQGGCASRRALNGQMDAHDDYCPWVRDDTIDLHWRPAPARDLMRSSNVCTTVVA